MIEYKEKIAPTWHISKISNKDFCPNYKVPSMLLSAEIPIVPSHWLPTVECRGWHMQLQTSGLLSNARKKREKYIISNELL